MEVTLEIKSKTLIYNLTKLWAAVALLLQSCTIHPKEERIAACRTDEKQKRKTESCFKAGAYGKG
jgi:hypothetical protein